MDKYIQAKKVNMTQVWTAEGKVVPVTVLHVDAGSEIYDLQPGTVIHISGRSRGRGFAGPVKRHGFHGAPASHGHDHPRAVGSIGNSFPQHTRPGMRMAGRMGGKNATVKNSIVITVDVENKLIVVKGGVPGHPESKVKIGVTAEKKTAPEIVKYVTAPTSQTFLTETKAQTEVPESPKAQEGEANAS